MAHPLDDNTDHTRTIQAAMLAEQRLSRSLSRRINWYWAGADIIVCLMLAGIAWRYFA